MNNIFRFPSGLRLAYKYSPAVRSVGIAVMTAVGSGNENRSEERRVGKEC